MQHSALLEAAELRHMRTAVAVVRIVGCGRQVLRRIVVPVHLSYGEVMNVRAFTLDIRRGIGIGLRAADMLQWLVVP